MPRCVLAGDMGGTKTLLALYRCEAGRVELLREARYASGAFSGLGEIVAAFLGGEAPLAACFGVAGPVVEGRCRTTNLPWLLDEKALSEGLGDIPVKLLNDLEAVALGLLRLPEGAFHGLNPGQAQTGNMAVIAAGTGLGEAMLHWDGGTYTAIAGEGGHCDFAPVDALQGRLWAFLRERFAGHVSYERILSGSGLHAVYEFFLAEGSPPSNPELTEALSRGDPAVAIARFGLEGRDDACRQSLNLFARIYGQEAGNLALKCLARGGVLLAGGIAPKLLPLLEEGAFMAGFCDKGRFAGMLRDMPVRVCLDSQAPLLGAAVTAMSLVGVKAGDE